MRGVTRLHDRWAAIAAAVVGMLLAASVTGGTVEAHADLERSVPAAGDVLAASPGTVQVTYTEEVAADQSDLRVLASDGSRVDLDDARLIEGDPHTMRVGVEELPDGAYTVQWNNLSAVDGHTRSGSFVFFVGSDEFAALDLGGDAAEDGVPIGEPLARWGTLLGLVLLAGAPWAFGMVLARTAPTDAASAVRGRLGRLAAVGGVVVLVAGAGQLALTLNDAGGGLSILADTRWGNGWALRMILAVLATVGYALGTARLPARERRLLPYLALGAALSVSLTSHGAATEDVAFVAGLVDALHILATVAWGGGLVAFLVLARAAHSERGTPERTEAEVLRSAIPRFAVLGGLATLTLAITGSYAAWVHVGSLKAAASTYGWGVGLKVLLLLVLVGIAAANTTWVRRRVSQPRPTESAVAGRRWLRRLLSAEVALIALVLGVSAVLTSIEPARQELVAEQRASGVVTESEDAGLTIHSTITPGNVGPNRVRIELLRSGERYGDATGVQLRYVNLEAALSASTVELEPQADGTWRLPDPAILSVDGVYEFDVRAQWPEGLDARQAVRFETGADRATALLNPSRAWWVGILALVAVGVAMVAANVLASRSRAVRGEHLGWVGAALVAGALLLWGRGPDTAALAANPIPPTEASLTQGAEIYAANCVSCHGEEFSGDGPQAGTLPVRPADLVLHFPQHSDGQHYAVIANGRPASGMPAWEGTLSDEEIWHVINYLRAETEARAPSLRSP